MSNDKSCGSQAGNTLLTNSLRLYSPIMRNKFTCIIPFHNEGKNTLSVIKKVLKVKLINQIICVDDGSTDGIYNTVKKTFPEVDIFRFKKNRGKANAVLAGVKRARNNNVVLLDADLKLLKSTELSKALNVFLSREDIDMLILKIGGTNKITDEALRKFIFQGGNRIMYKKDLQKIQALSPTGYQLEVAINKFMLDNRKNYYWVEFSAFNPHKSRKSNFWQGLYDDFKMNNQIINYLGIKDYLSQMFLFARKELK